MSCRSASCSSSRQRSLFRDSNEDRNKREGVTIQKMEDATSEYLKRMEDDSGFFGTASSDAFGCSHRREETAPPPAAASEGQQPRDGCRNGNELCNRAGIAVVPRFEPHEIELQTTIGMGEFGVVLKVKRIGLDHQTENDDDDDDDDENRISRIKLANANSMLVIKQIRKDLYPKKRIEAAKDLAREAKFLSRLQQLHSVREKTQHHNHHPNLITLRGIVSTPGSPDFGILFDRLHLTLEELSINWGNYQENLLQRYSTHRSRKRGLALPMTLPQWWGSPDHVLGATLGKITQNVGGFFQSEKDVDAASGVGNQPVSAQISAARRALLLLGERVLALFDVSEGMGHLHAHRILFRDLKPENVGRSISGSGAGGPPQAQQRLLQIFDFGLAKECKPRDRVRTGGPSSFDENGGGGGGGGSNADRTPSSSSSSSSNIGFYDHYKMTGLTGTRRIMAPEVIRCQPYGLPADVYSFGICLWEVFAGTKCNFLSPAQICNERQSIRPEPPLVFDDDDDDDATKRSDKSSSRSSRLGMPRKLQALMERCWHEDPSQRPSFPEISAMLRSVLGDLARQARTMAFAVEPKRPPPPPAPQPKLPYDTNNTKSSLFSKATSGGTKYLASPWRTCVNGMGSRNGVGGDSFWTTMIRSTSSKRRQQQRQPPVDTGGRRLDAASLDQSEVLSRLESLRVSGLLDD